MAETRKSSRCAICTRKCTEHNVDLEFNLLRSRMLPHLKLEFWASSAGDGLDAAPE